MTSAPILILLWCFAVGACVGSFLNVVAWRLPLGMSLLWPSSHCPRCKKPILLRDNVPVLGWLILGGRCRACKAPIAARYPIVEFLTGIAFAALACVELVRPGFSWPGELPDAPAALLTMWVYHSLLAAFLIVTALFEIDAATVPPRFIALGLAGGLIPPLFWPELRPLLSTAIIQRTEVGTPETGLLGAMVGLLIGLPISWGSSGKRFDKSVLLGCPSLALVFAGAFLGPQAVLPIAAATGAVMLVVRLAEVATHRTLLPAATVAAVFTIGYILFWRQLTELRWPGQYDSAQIIVLTVAATVLLGFALADCRVGRCGSAYRRNRSDFPLARFVMPIFQHSGLH